MRLRPALLLLATLASSCAPAGEFPAEELPGAPAGGGGATLPGTGGETSTNEAPKPPAATHSCDDARPGKVGDQALELEFGGQARKVLLHVPKRYDPKKGAPLVLAFHGYGGSAEQMRGQTGLDAAADTAGFIVAYAEGLGLAQKGFNAGECCGTSAWGGGDVDDVGLARAVIGKLSRDYCVDPKRVHSAGFSNGGFMSYRFVCEAADLFASVASVSGVLGVDPAACNPKRPVPMLHVHGTADRTVKYEGGGAAGGLGTLAGIRFRSVAESVATLRKKYGCQEAAQKGFTRGDTRCEAWAGCKDDARVELCTIEDGGHQWPGGEPVPLSGKTSTDLSATKAIVEFFAAHPMR